jgi:hypothetical protein
MSVWDACGRWEMCALFLLECRKIRKRKEDQDVDGKIVLKWVSGTQGGRLWTGFTWDRPTGRWRVPVNAVRNSWIIPWLQERISASRRTLFSTELLCVTVKLKIREFSVNTTGFWELISTVQNEFVTRHCEFRLLTLWSRSSYKCYLRIQSVPQREHHTSPLQRSTG